MSPAERTQAAALLAQAEALREQAYALMHLAEGQIRAVNALLGAEPPSPEALAVAEQIFQPPKYYGRKQQPEPTPTPSGE